MQFEQIGKYRIVGKLGKGAMGEVFRARDPVLDREVAIKVVAAKLSGDDAARRRFAREAKAVAALSHPNIITVYDFGEHLGMAYMVMEILDEGQDLKDLIKKKALPVLEARVAIMEQICDGLAFAHRKGVVHQDLKPGNIRILSNGGVKVMDFGLALRQEDSASGPILGTPYYIAPEQIRGDRPTARSDVFSLGAVFYEFLSGGRPFTGPNIQEILRAVVRTDPVPLTKAAPDLPPPLSAFVDRAMAKDPSVRYADADEMLEALRAAWLGGEFPDSGLAADATPARALGPSLSASSDTSPALKEALGDLEQYLADLVPPLMVADVVDELQRAPVEGAAAELWNWAEGRLDVQKELDLVSLLHHALHKLNVLGELNLLPSEPLLEFLKKVGQALAEACPPGERERLLREVRRLGEEVMFHSGPLARLDPEDEDPGPSVAQARRISILEQRLRLEGLGKAPANDPVRRRVVAHALAAAVAGARSDRELSGDLRRLGAAGLGGGAGAVFKNLGDGLANWALPRDLAQDTAPLSPPAEVEAMEKIVSLSEDPVEVARRYRHLVTAATEQFNEGNLGRAVQMFDLARKMSAEERIEPGYVIPIRGRGHEALDDQQLRRFMENPERRAQLRQVMAFFEPGFGVPTLLDQAELEERRDRRRLLLDLLVVHGEAARAEALTRLQASLDTQVSDFARRNWIYLLRLVPRSADGDVEAELEVVSRFAGPGIPLFLVKEALSHLGLVKHPGAGRALAALLGRWESYLLQPDIESEDREGGFAALDRLAAALARQDSTRGWEALIDHGLSGKPEFGLAPRRIEELGSQDLSSSRDVVDRLLGEIEDSLPRGVLGRLVGRKDQDLPFLVAALAGTRTPEVKEVLEEVADRLEGQEAGKVATRILRAPPPAGPLAGLAGKLDSFELPTLLHRVAQEKATGTLTLRFQEGTGTATVAFVRGRPVSARWDRRQGVDALYQLFLRPFPASYSFDATTTSGGGGPALPDVPTLVREGIRRGQELERVSALVPDDASLEATGTPPSAVPDEPDYELVVSLWEKACAGVPPGQIEADLTVDAYRVRHALGHWLEEGALRVTTPAGSEPTSPEAAKSDPGT